MGLISDLDRAAFAAYCQAWGRWVEAEEALKTYGLMLKSPSGFPVQSPYLAVADRALEQMRSLPFDEEHFRKEVGVPALNGEAGRSTLERLWARPTCEVNGLLSGYTGEGAKTVLPARAMAKVSCRLVPDQSPDEIAALVTAHVRRIAPKKSPSIT